MNEINEEDFNKVVIDIINRISKLEYKDKSKSVLKSHILINICKFLEDYKTYGENIDILNMYSSNGLESEIERNRRNK